MKKFLMFWVALFATVVLAGCMTKKADTPVVEDYSSTPSVVEDTTVPTTITGEELQNVEVTDELNQILDETTSSGEMVVDPMTTNVEATGTDATVTPPTVTTVDMTQTQ